MSVSKLVYRLLPIVKAITIIIIMILGLGLVIIVVNRSDDLCMDVNLIERGFDRVGCSIVIYDVK